MLYVARDQARRWADEAKDDSAVAPTGYQAFDVYLKRGGLRRGHLAGLLGRSGVGKTAVVCNIISRLAEARVPVLFSSQEMTQQEVTNRLLAIHYGLPVSTIETKFKNDTLDPRWLEKYAVDFGGLIVDDTNEMTFDNLSSACTAFDALLGGRPQVIVQDYLNYMSQQGLFGNESVKVARQAQLMKGLAKAENVAILTLVQTGRANESDSNKRNHGHIPLTMEDMMYGGEQSMDVMLGMFRPELDPALWDPTLEGDAHLDAQMKLNDWRNKAVFQVVKNRFGPTHYEGHQVSIDWNTMMFN